MRPLVFFVYAFILGISLSYSLVNKSEIIISVIIMSFLFILYLYKFNIRKFILIGSLIFFIFGLFEFLVTDRNITIEYSEDKGFLEGKVVGIKKDYVKEEYEYIVNIKKSYLNKYNFKVKLYTRNDIKIEYNDYIKTYGKIVSTSSKNNKNLLGRKNYYYSLKISGTIYSDSIMKIKSSNKFSIIALGYKIKSKILEFISKKFEDKETALLAGMIIGDDSYQNEQMKDDFRKSGLSHIMVASGANLLYIIVPLVIIFKKIRVKSKYYNIVIIIILFIYVTVTGFDMSIVRAFIMAFILLVSKVIKKDYDVYTSICFSALLNLIYNPYVFLNIGFQLSYIATISIVIFYNKMYLLNINKLPKLLKDTLTVTLSVQIGVMPILVLYFNKIPIISILTNLFVVPITGLVTLIGILSYFVFFVNEYLSNIFIYINKFLLDFILMVSEKSSDLSFSTVDYFFRTSNIIIILYVIFLIAFFYTGKRKYTIISALIIVVLFINYSSYIVKEDKLEMTFIDVGEGDSIYIEIDGAKILLDGGNNKKNGDYSIDYGKDRVKPFLNLNSVNKLDMVIASHNHSDHVGGLEYILKYFDVEKFIYSESYDEYEILEEINKEKVNKIFVNSEDIIYLNNETYIKILNPENGKVDENENNNSIVFMLYYKDFKGLFCGDIEKETENKLLEKEYILESDLLKVGHHGSDTSSTRDFIEKVNPKVAVITVGKNNFGHPSCSVLKRLNSENVKVLRTDLRGNIKITTFGDDQLIIN